MLKRFNNRLDEVEQQVERPNNGTHQDSATNRKKNLKSEDTLKGPRDKIK